MKLSKTLILADFAYFLPFLAKFPENQTFSGHLTLTCMNQNIIVIIKSHFKPFQVERIEKRQFIWKKNEKFRNFFWGKMPGSLKGESDWKFFFAFLCSKWLIFENWAKKIFQKRKISEKKFPGPAKMAVFGHISAKKFNFDMRFFLNGQIWFVHSF